MLSRWVVIANDDVGDERTPHERTDECIFIEVSIAAVSFSSLHAEMIYTFSLATRKLSIISVIMSEGQS